MSIPIPENNAALSAIKQHGLHPPGMLTFSITAACNLVCSHCWVEAEPTSTVHVPEETIRRILLEYRELGGCGIRLTGGEPLLHPAGIRLLSFARTTGFDRIAMQTNAILLQEKDVSALRDLNFPGLTLQISLDGATAETHDRVRGSGAFDGVLQGIRRLAAAGLAGNVSIFFTEMRHNLEEIPLLLELAETLGIPSVSTGALVLCGRAEKESLVAPPEQGQYFSLLHRYESDPDFRFRYERIGTTAAIEWLKGDAARNECCTFVENPYLTPGGRLYPCVLCHSDQFAVEDVFAKGMVRAIIEGAPIWSALKKTSHVRSSSIPECRDCPGEASCGGGCMGRAWGSCGDFMSPDDRCGLRRAIYLGKK